MQMILLFAPDSDPVANALQERLSAQHAQILRVNPDQLVFAPVWVNEVSETGESTTRIQLSDGSYIMGSDCPPARFRKLAGFSLNINLGDTKEAEHIYKVMSEKGEVFMPLEETFWAERFAMFEDRFGVPWMINVEKEQR